MKQIILILICNILFSGCNSSKRSTIIYIYSSDKTKVISIISNYKTNERIIAVGKVLEKPSSNYVRLDISDITELEDEIGICWTFNNEGWQIVNNNSKIEEIVLDTTKYKVKTRWYEDENGIPNTKYYIRKDCFTFGTLRYSKNYPKDNGVIERLDN
ncbi:hypothetical protein [Flavobacterium sp. KACC 22763]|uniref:hypothetical protein n=1 Tax=Flavobacterium sp. KACC 22763 TaxID=3025668 RepID=UPI00236558B1|nr:hypothetical protein [Flavobacterium sp. KACC 22763]WDF65929.1 hypothetical protein PQ463_07100 [Flavobacterium sp. KACC 22763]